MWHPFLKCKNNSLGSRRLHFAFTLNISNKGRPKVSQKNLKLIAINAIMLLGSLPCKLLQITPCLLLQRETLLAITICMISAALHSSRYLRKEDFEWIYSYKYSNMQETLSFYATGCDICEILQVKIKSKLVTRSCSSV